MTVAQILAKMLVLDNELDIGAGGADETRAITAIDMAQDAFEGVIANVPDLLGTVGALATIAVNEATVWPSTLLRLDNLWLLDSSGKQRWQINVIQDVGAQTPNAPWPFNASSVSSGNGAPTDCYTNRANFYWRPIPDAIYNLRAYGLYAKDDLEVRGDVLEYPDLIGLPLAAYGVRLMEMGIDDPSEELKALADETFNPAISALKRPVRQRPESRVYSRVHTT